MDLFPFFFLAKAALACLPTAYYVALKSLFRFWQAQFVQVFPKKSAPFCKHFAGLGSTNKSATSLLLSSSPTQALSSPHCFFLRFFYLKLSGTSGRNYLFFLPSLLPNCNGSLDTHFSQATTQLITWLGRVRYSCHLHSLATSFI